MISTTLNSIRKPIGLLALMCAFVGFAAAQTPEQDSDSLYRETYAIVGAKIEVGAGKVIDKGNVIVRNGRIVAVGADASIPDYAYVIKGDGLIVYPGFIDGYSTKALKMPDPGPDQDVKQDTGVSAPISMREANRKGIRPELNAADFLDLSGVEDDRKAGIACELVAPSGGVMNGSAVFINTSGRPSRETIYVPTFGECVGARDPGDGYPATPLGIMALLRQTFLDAQRAALPLVTGNMPMSDRSLLALQPVLKGSTPLLLEADRNFEIARCLGLADQFNTKSMIVGGLDAFTQIDALKKNSVPVLLALNYAAEPKPAKPTPPAGEKPAGAVATPPAGPPSGPGQGGPSTRNEDAENVPQEVMAERETKWLDRVHSAKALHDAGILFAFSSRGSRDRDEFWKNVRRVISEGLDRQVALDALTINAAKIFGVSKDLGTVEKGKIASLTIMDGDFAKDGSAVKYMFDGGRFFDLSKAKTIAPGFRRRRGFIDDGTEGIDGDAGVGR
jgi:hypothetical protein